MKNFISHTVAAYKMPTLKSLLSVLVGMGVFFPAICVGAALTTGGANIASKPLYVGSAVAPVVMLNVTKDHQLFYRAYNDYTDLDGDGKMDITYKNSIDYYGYFDSKKCYSYSATAGYFSPTVVTADHYCSGQWSGNFLNWVSMTRIDVMRKVLYGGMRAVDEEKKTVLERAFVPTDAHSWVKFYDGEDLKKLTPYDHVDEAKAYSGSAVTVGTGSKDFNNVDNTKLLAVQGDQVRAISSTDPSKIFLGVVSNTPGTTNKEKITLNIVTGGAPAGSASLTGWNLTNLTYKGISFCNVTAPSGVVYSQDAAAKTSPPLIRVVRGNYSLWAANERMQCVYSTEKTANTAGSGNNGNNVGVSKVYAATKHAPLSRGLTSAGGITAGSKPDYIARVLVCNKNLIGAENCKNYKTGVSENLKPIGLLQKNGETDAPLMRFGLFTGSYDKNISGGVLRKNALPTLSSSLAAQSPFNEIDPVDGTFETTPVGIIGTINRLRMYNYRFNYTNDDGYRQDASSDDKCDYQLMGMVHANETASNVGGGFAHEGRCASWGNPMGELYYETLRYLAGKAKTDAFDDDDNRRDKELGLPVDVKWVNPISSSTLYCTPLNILGINASSVSYDDLQYGGFSDFGAKNQDGGAAALNDFTNAIGKGEKFTGTGADPLVVGHSGIGVSNGMCTAKAVTNFADVTGICPDTPSQKGSYQMAGLAYFAHTQKIRNDWTVPATDTKSLKVTTYGVQLASSTPVIELNVNGKKVVITPTYRLVSGTLFGSGTMVDFRPIGVPNETTGTFYIAWEDSNQGGDYDQDVWGTIRYDVDGDTVKVTTQAMASATANGQGFGFTIAGTSKDGPHFYSGITAADGNNPFTFTDPTNIVVTDFNGLTIAGVNATGGCEKCADTKSSISYIPRRSSIFTAVSGGSAKTLKDPLFYAAKWGGFLDVGGVALSKTDSPSAAYPDITGEWDSEDSNGQVGSDGVPDNYFYVINPANLEASLQRAFLAILRQGSSAALATNSASLNTGSRLYQAGFNSDKWSGWLKSISLSTTTGNLDTTVWNTDDTMTRDTGRTHFVNPTTRNVTTFNGTEGKPFKWNDLTAVQQTLLNAGDSYGQDRLNYLRGDASLELTRFRERFGSILGDIVSSSPLYVGVPQGQYDYPQTQYRQAYLSDASYATWRSNTAQFDRTAMLYAGSNDGMLHGFDAATGAEKFAYVPNAVFPRLAALTVPNYTHEFTVDGPPNVADVKILTDWKTVLVAGLGAGGRGVYALDVTNPASFSEANVLWEFSSANDPDLGYTFSKPIIAKMNNGKWAAIFGNGYYKVGDTVGTTATAQLFVLYIEEGKNGWDGSDYKKIDTKVGSLASPNGIGHIVGVDKNLDGTVDYVYGGNMQGNMWKFDLSGSAASAWGVAYGTAAAPAPLITVCSNRSSTTNCNNSRQPIVTRPTYSFHPDDLSTLMVYFGTGKYFEAGDQTNADKQTMYGVWDQGVPLGQLSTLTADQKNVQTLTDPALGVEGFRTVTAIAEDWTKHKLWMEDLPKPGERQVGVARVLSGALLYNTYIPSDKSCQQAGTGYLMGVRYQNGGRLDFKLFDTSGNNQVGNEDVEAAGIELGGALGGVTVLSDPSSVTGGVKIYVPKTDAQINTISAAIKTNGKRIGWRELLRN